MSDGAIVELVAVFLGMMVILIPIAGLTLRFAVKPIIEPIVRSIRELREGQGASADYQRRILLMEEELDEVRQGIRTLVQAHQFDRKLTDSTETPDS